MACVVLAITTIAKKAGTAEAGLVSFGLKIGKKVVKTAKRRTPEKAKQTGCASTDGKWTPGQIE